MLTKESPTTMPRANRNAAAQLLIAAKGDEVLDWRDMVARYPAAELLLQEGGDHALSNFDAYLPQIDHFMGW